MELSEPCLAGCDLEFGVIWFFFWVQIFGLVNFEVYIRNLSFCEFLGLVNFGFAEFGRKNIGG